MGVDEFFLAPPVEVVWEKVIFLVVLTVVVVWEVFSKKVFGATGSVIKRDDHPWLYNALLLAHILIVAALTLFAIHTLWLKPQSYEPLPCTTLDVAERYWNISFCVIAIPGGYDEVVVFRG